MTAIGAVPPVPPATHTAPRPAFVVGSAQVAAAQSGAAPGRPDARNADQTAAQASQPAGVLQAAAVAATVAPQTIQRATILGAVRVDASTPVKQGSVATPTRPGQPPASPNDARRLDLSV